MAKPKEPKEQYRWVGDHAQEIVMGEAGVMTPSGGFVDLTEADVKANNDMIESGMLVKVDEGGDK